MMGHTHHCEEVPTKRIDRATGICIGCLCNLDLEYNFSHLTTLRQQQGFAFGWVTPQGKALVRRARNLGWVWDIPL
jgi:hypothetical protein